MEERGQPFLMKKRRRVHTSPRIKMKESVFFLGQERCELANEGGALWQIII